MKKGIAVVLLLSLILGLVACKKTDDPGQTTEPAVTESPEDAQTLKILMIGDSSGNDTMWLTYDVFKAEQPDRKVVIGNLYYSSCRMSAHAQYATEETPAYTYHRNDSGKWDIMESYSIRYALEEEHWDVVIIQETNHLGGIDEYYQNENIATLTAYIKKVLGYQPKILWNMLWVNPVGFDDWIEDVPSDSWISHYREHYDTSIDNMYAAITRCAKTYVVDKDNGVTGILTPATTIQHAMKVQMIHEKDLFRDYTHLNDYGRTMVGYCLYAQVLEAMEGEAPELTEIKLTRVPSFMRQSRFSSQGDLVLTPEQQKSIVDAVNYTVKNPMNMPE